MVLGTGSIWKILIPIRRWRCWESTPSGTETCSLSSINWQLAFSADYHTAGSVLILSYCIVALRHCNKTRHSENQAVCERVIKEVGWINLLMGMCWEVWSWLQEPLRNKQQNLERQCWHIQFYFLLLVRQMKWFFFLLLQASLCLDLVSLMQAQKVVLKGHIQFIVGHSKTQILYFRCWW